MSRSGVPRRGRPRAARWGTVAGGDRVGRVFSSDADWAGSRVGPALRGPTPGRLEFNGPRRCSRSAGGGRSVARPRGVGRRPSRWRGRLAACGPPRFTGVGPPPKEGRRPWRLLAPGPRVWHSAGDGGFGVRNPGPARARTGLARARPVRPGEHRLGDATQWSAHAVTDAASPAADGCPGGGRTGRDCFFFFFFFFLVFCRLSREGQAELAGGQRAADRLWKPAPR